MAAPDLPIIGTATKTGSTTATVAFAAPLNDGGSTITSYTALSTPGSISASSATSPITVTGLNPGTNYTFTVTATNADGTSGPSSPSNQITTDSTAPSAPTIGIATKTGTSTARLFPMVSQQLAGRFANRGSFPASGSSSKFATRARGPLNSPITISSAMDEFCKLAAAATGTSVIRSPSIISPKR